MKVSTSILQNNFGKYLKYVENGTEVTITKNGKSIAKLNGIADAEAVGESLDLYQVGNKMTYKEYLDFDKEESRYEFIDGYIYLQSSPRYIHQLLLQRLIVQMSSQLKKTNCQPLFAPFDVTLYRNNDKNKEPSVVQPDLLVICDKENINSKGEYKGLPTLIIEILSPTNRSYDMIKKLDLYKSAGVSEYWIVDPSQSNIFIYNFKSNDIDSISCFHKGDLIVSKTFNELGICVDDLFCK